MQITMNNTLYPGLSAMQVGQSRVDQAATQIASSNIEVSGRSQSSDFQLENLRSVDRSQRSDLSSNMVELEAGKDQFAAGLAAQKASNEMLGTLIDTYALFSRQFSPCPQRTALLPEFLRIIVLYHACTSLRPPLDFCLRFSRSRTTYACVAYAWAVDEWCVLRY